MWQSCLIEFCIDHSRVDIGHDLCATEMSSAAGLRSRPAEMTSAGQTED